MENVNEKYEAPEVLVVECQVEKGFALSSGIGEDLEEGVTG